MAKRLTDTTKWDNPSFRKIPNKYKIFYLYLLDKCDCAGVVHIDIELISLVLHEQYDIPEIESFLGSKLVFLSPEKDKVIIRNYIRFQNGDIFDSKSNISKAIITELNRHGIKERYERGEFGSPLKSIFD